MDTLPKKIEFTFSSILSDEKSAIKCRFFCNIIVCFTTLAILNWDVFEAITFVFLVLGGFLHFLGRIRARKHRAFVVIF